jgi:hypothetical protein
VANAVQKNSSSKQGGDSETDKQGTKDPVAY